MIYLIVCHKTESCKIGYSLTPENRMSQLQTGNPFALSLVATIEGDINKEKELHKLFAQYKVSGEWFSYCNEIKEFFKVEEFILVTKGLFQKIMILSNPAARVYFYLLYLYADGTVFEIKNNTKEEIKKDLHLGISSVSNGLTELKESGLLYHHSRGTYQINPRYAFKGSANNRNKALKAIIELGCKEC